jgi:serine/threonine protein kinase
LGEEEGQAYIVMEYVEGLTLDDLIPEGGMPIEQVGRYAAQIAGALGFAHHQGVIHGDLKGSNILVTATGNLKLLDFGLGRRIPRSGMAEVSGDSLPLTEAGAMPGTLPYLAPEILRGNPSSLQSDVWALGVLLYKMATGELPFSGATPFELCVEIMAANPPRLALLPEPLLSTLRRCLEKDANARFQEVREVASTLEGTASGGVPNPPVHVAPISMTTVEPPALRHAAWRTAGIGTSLLVLLLGGIYARHLWLTRHTAQPVSAAQIFKASSQGNPDVKVWVNTGSGVYHCPGTRWYGKTLGGEYMLQKEAQSKGYHPAAGHACT